MCSALLHEASPRLARHLTVGCSTGFMEQLRGDWPAAAERAARLSSFAVELSAVSEPELPGLLEYLASGPILPFHYVSVHGPSKARALSDAALVAALDRVPAWVDAIVVHPDTIGELAPYAALGCRLVLENMDTRKPAGHTAEQLAPFFAALPEAGLCLDLAHAKDVDATLRVAAELLDRFGDRLRHLHLSSLDQHRSHVALTPEDEDLFAPLLDRCRDVPWILEAPLRAC